MRVLVTGGAGYIGSVVVEALRQQEHDVVVVDDLRQGHADALPADVPLEVFDVRDTARLTPLVRGVDAVVHLAAWSIVGASMRAPERYFANNVGGTASLLEAMSDAGVKRLVFSSTAAVYGTPRTTPIDEDDATTPTNPYGASKLAVEQLLAWWSAARGASATCLRYFNAAGASERCSERHHPETHLVPLVLDAARDGTSITIFGDDYPTPDGTCVRDYVHVVDLARAHVLALTSATRGRRIYNLGCGTGGHSVRAVIDAVERVTGRSVAVRVGPRRDGDPAVLVASIARAVRELRWSPRQSDLDTIVRSAALHRMPRRSS